jgi:protein TonB
MTLHCTLVRMTPIVASLLLHVVAYGAIAMVPKFVSVRERVLIADLVEPDPAPPPPAVAPPRPKAPDRRPVTPPRRIETPVPVERPSPPPVETPSPPVAAPLETPSPPGAQEAPAPGPVPVRPDAPAGPAAVSAVPRATAPIDALPAGPGEGLPPAAPEPGERTGPSIAALPPAETTRTAVPRGSYQVRPSYPHSARRLGVQGTTLLSVFVTVDGRVGDVVVKQSAGHPDLDQAAADAVRRWRFEPARRGAEAIAMWVLLPVEFRLR